MVDGSYLSVPDNPRYEESAVIWFDGHNHPIGKEAREKPFDCAHGPEALEGLTPAARKRCRRQRRTLHVCTARLTVEDETPNSL